MAQVEQGVLRPSLTQDRVESVPAPWVIEPSRALRVVRAFPEPWRKGSPAEMARLPDHSGLAMNHEKRQVEIAGLYRQLRETELRTDEFLAVVGHELRGPLAAIHNAVQIACSKGVGDPEHLLATSVIQHQVSQMTRLVDDLLDVSRVKRGKIQLQREQVDLKDVVERALEDSAVLSSTRGNTT